MQKTILFALVIIGLLGLGGMSCGQQAPGYLNMQNPGQAGASEIVVIKIADDAGKPVSGVRIYGPGYLGDITESGGLVTFFWEPGDYELIGRKTKTGGPGSAEHEEMSGVFDEVKGRITIIPSPVELRTFDGIPPLLPPGQIFAGELAYKPGMTVRFRLKNLSNEVIVLYSPVPWKIQSRKGETVFEPDGVPSVIKVPPVIKLAPGESREWNWNQQDKDRQQVSEGGYMVVLRCSKGEYGLGFSIVPEGWTP